MGREWAQTRVCDGTFSDTTCDVTFQTEEKVHAYLAEVENFTVTIQHSMRTPEIVQELDMKDRGLGLLVCNDKVYEELSSKGSEGRRLKDAAMAAKLATCKLLPPDKTLISEPGGPDLLKLGALLKVAGVDLDKNS